MDSKTLITDISNDPEISSKVLVTDRDVEYDLTCFCYDTCTNKDSDKLKQCRGLVFQSNNLLLKTYSYADEYTSIEMIPSCEEEFDSVIDHYESCEGTLLRMYWVEKPSKDVGKEEGKALNEEKKKEGKWFLSTHKKLDAFHSKWSSRYSFGVLFTLALEKESLREPLLSFMKDSHGDNVFERFQNTLDKKKQYTFLLRNNSENRIVCDVPNEQEPCVFHVGTFSHGSYINNWFEDQILPQPVKHKFNTVSDLIDFINNKGCKEIQGIISLTKEGKQVKVVSEEYYNKFKIRGNQPSINFRYLQLLNDEVELKELKELYPNHNSTFTEYDNILKEIAILIHRAYIERFIEKKYVVVTPDKYQVIKKCHAWHIENRQKNIVTLNVVQHLLLQQGPVKLNSMIKIYDF